MIETTHKNDLLAAKAIKEKIADLNVTMAQAAACGLVLEVTQLSLLHAGYEVPQLEVRVSRKQ